MLTTLLKAIPAVVVTVLFSIVALIAIPFDGRGKVFHRLARTWSKVLLWLFRVKVIVRGMANLERSGHYVYVANHADTFDIPAVLAGIPDEIRIILKRELTRIPLWGWALKLGPYISIDRFKPMEAAESLERAAETIRHGASVLIFAEGTRSKDGRLQPFKRGAFALAARSGVPIVPVTINNSFGIMPKGSLTVRPKTIELVLDRPIENTGARGKKEEMELLERVHAILKRNFVESGEAAQKRQHAEEC